MLLFLIFFPMAAGFLCWLLGKRSAILRSNCATITAGVELALTIILAFGENRIEKLSNICSLGIQLELDGFRKVYIIIIAFMWFMTLLLSDEYFSHYHKRGRYYFFNLMTLGATMGVFLASDLFSAFIFFEIMSFTSYTWVLQEETQSAIRAANTYLAVAVIGGLVALMGLFLMQYHLGTTEISKLYSLAQACQEKKILYIAGGCILFGFGAKAGMFPLHIWLPKAHPVAPAPASALLSGVLTKSGIWGILAISCNVFRNDPAWGTLILTLGTITMVLGAILALLSIDLKRTLACSSMSQIGFVLVGVGMMGILGEDNALAARGTLLHMMNHSLFKLVLFECAGVVYMNLHQLNLNEVRGFGRGKPILNAVFLIGAMGIGGIPLLNGYVSKTLLHEAIIEGGRYGLVEWLFLISGGLTVAYMTKLYVCLFIEKNPKKQMEQEQITQYMNRRSTIALLIPAAVLLALGLGANVFMNGIADIGTDFLHAGKLEHAIHYLSFENLKGAGISIAIGAIIYLCIVRKLLLRDGKYIDVLPEKLDLENAVYRPLILKILPAFFGEISRLFGENRISAFLWHATVDAAGRGSEEMANNKITGFAARGIMRLSDILCHIVVDSIDAFTLLLRKTIYRESRIPTEGVFKSFSYRMGNYIDRVEVRRGKEAPDEHRYARLAYRAQNTFFTTARRISGNLSFALLMLCVAVCFVFLYVATYHG